MMKTQCTSRLLSVVITAVLLSVCAGSGAVGKSAQTATNFQQVADQYLKTGFKDISNTDVATLITGLKKKDPNFNPDSILRNFAAEKLAEGKSQNDVAQAMMDIVGQVMKAIPPRPLGVAVTDNIDEEFAARVSAAEQAAEKAYDKAFDNAMFFRTGSVEEIENARKIAQRAYDEAYVEAMDNNINEDNVDFDNDQKDETGIEDRQASKTNSDNNQTDDHPYYQELWQEEYDRAIQEAKKKNGGRITEADKKWAKSMADDEVRNQKMIDEEQAKEQQTEMDIYQEAYDRKYSELIGPYVGPFGVTTTEKDEKEFRAIADQAGKKAVDEWNSRISQEATNSTTNPEFDRALWEADEQIALNKTINDVVADAIRIGSGSTAPPMTDNQPAVTTVSSTSPTSGKTAKEIAAEAQAIFEKGYNDALTEYTSGGMSIGEADIRAPQIAIFRVREAAQNADPVRAKAYQAYAATYEEIIGYGGEAWTEEQARLAAQRAAEDTMLEKVADDLVADAARVGSIGTASSVADDPPANSETKNDPSQDKTFIKKILNQLPTTSNPGSNQPSSTNSGDLDAFIRSNSGSSSSTNNDAKKPENTSSVNTTQGSSAQDDQRPSPERVKWQMEAIFGKGNESVETTPDSGAQTEAKGIAAEAQAIYDKGYDEALLEYTDRGMSTGEADMRAPGVAIFRVKEAAEDATDPVRATAFQAYATAYEEALKYETEYYAQEYARGEAQRAAEKAILDKLAEDVVADAERALTDTSDTFIVTVNAVNDAPTTPTSIENQTISDRDDKSIDLPGVVTDPDNESVISDGLGDDAAGGADWVLTDTSPSVTDDFKLNPGPDGLDRSRTKNDAPIVDGETFSVTVTDVQGLPTTSTFEFDAGQNGLGGSQGNQNGNRSTLSILTEAGLLVGGTLAQPLHTPDLQTSVTNDNPFVTKIDPPIINDMPSDTFNDDSVVIIEDVPRSTITLPGDISAINDNPSPDALGGDSNPAGQPTDKQNRDTDDLLIYDTTMVYGDDTDPDYIGFTTFDVPFKNDGIPSDAINDDQTVIIDEGTTALPGDTSASGISNINDDPTSDPPEVEAFWDAFNKARKAGATLEDAKRIASEAIGQKDENSSQDLLYGRDENSISGDGTLTFTVSLDDNPPDETPVTPEFELDIAPDHQGGTPDSGNAEGQAGTVADVINNVIGIPRINNNTPPIDITVTGVNDSPTIDDSMPSDKLSVTVDDDSGSGDGTLTFTVSLDDDTPTPPLDSSEPPEDGLLTPLPNDLRTPARVQDMRIGPHSVEPSSGTVTSPSPTYSDAPLTYPPPLNTPSLQPDTFTYTITDDGETGESANPADEKAPPLPINVPVTGINDSPKPPGVTVTDDPSSSTTMDIDLIDSNYKHPQQLKRNIAIDKKLPFGFTNNVIASAERAGSTDPIPYVTPPLMFNPNEMNFFSPDPFGLGQFCGFIYPLVPCPKP